MYINLCNKRKLRFWELNIVDKKIVIMILKATLNIITRTQSKKQFREVYLSF